MNLVSWLASLKQSRRSSKSRFVARSCQLLEVLEWRVMLSATPYMPASHLLFNPSGMLSAPASGEPLDIAMDYLRTHATDLGLTASDLYDPVVTSQYRDTDTSITHLYMRQTVGGLEVANADLNIHLTAAGEVISVGGGFMPGLTSWTMTSGVEPRPALSAEAAVRAAAIELGLTPTGDLTVDNGDSGQSYIVTAPGISLDDISARLHYVPTAEESAMLAWQLIVRTPDGQHWYDLSVDASSGSIVDQNDWVNHASYTVLPLPTENPDDGPFQVVVDPHLAATNASPFGWHDTNGIAGAESTLTLGNNVDAHLDRDGNNVADVGGRPDGSAALNFNFTFNPALTPLQNANPAVTNLFYWNNVLHDVHFQYGFTSSAGNFQTNTYGLGGAGNDAVQADAQDNATGGSANNANFATPPDGSAPRMQMFEFTSTSPRRDSDMDPSIIVHEYGHGVSNRLTGGPANSSALSALQSGGMGEGWSDWWSLMFRQSSASDTTDARGVGMYVLGQPSVGLGIREYRYDFDIVNQANETFLDFGTGVGQSTQVHNVGTRWASALWDLNHLLIQKYGYQSSIYNGSSSAGNIRALHLVMNGLKLQPANPTFIQARDAILAADTALHGAANHLEIWTAFAHRGLGFGASTTSSGSALLTTSFSLPPAFQVMSVASTTPAVGSTVTTAQTTFVVNFTVPYLASSVNASDFAVNGIPATGFVLTDADTVTFTYGVSPASVQGLQTMTIAAGAILQASNSAGNLAFSGQFRYDAVSLAVTSTVPPANGVLTLPAPFTFDVNFNESIAPGSVTTDDLLLSVGTVTGAIALDADTARYTIAGITAEVALNVTIFAGKVADTFGNLNTAVFSANYVTDIGTVPYPVPLVAKPPAGSLIYDPSISGVIGVPGDIDQFTLNIDPGQTISVLVDPTGSGAAVAPVVVLRDPANVVLGSASAGAGLNALLQTLPTTTGGIYTIAVSSAGTNTGGYSVQVVLNAAIEEEGKLTGSTNNTLATAQNINASFIDLGGLGSLAERGAVSGQVIGGPPNNLIVNGGFESPTSPFAGWTVSPFIGVNGWAANTGAYDPVSPATPTPPISGLVDIVNDSTGPGIRTITQSFVVPAVVTQATLSWSDRIQNFASVFQDPNQEFRVQILNNGGAVLQTVFSTNAGDPLTQIGPNNRSFDVTSLLQANAGQVLQLRFEEQDSLFYFNVSLDNISLSVQSGPTTVDSDLYAFSVDAGESVTLALEATTGSGVNVELLNAAGVVIATGSGGPTNFDRVISNFVIPGTGVYYARVSGPTTAEYNLIVTQNAAFDTEGNNSFAAAQTLNGLEGALGAITADGGVTVVNNAVDSGWISSDGTHLTTNNNYFVGQAVFNNDPTATLRNYATFSLPATTANIVGAELRLFNPSSGYNSPDPTETYTLFDVSATAAALDTNRNAGDATGIAIHADLGSGTVYGTRVVSAADNGSGTGTTVAITLNPAALAALNAAIGSTVSLGGAITTLAGTVQQSMFGFTDGALGTVQLVLQTNAESDWYSVNVTSTNNALRLETSTPADGPGELVNNLNPKIELYSPSNVLVASGTVLGDGRNEFIDYIPTTTGTYRVRVRQEGNSIGEYFLSKKFSPLVSVSVTSPIDENGTATLSGTLSDPDTLEAHTVVINWGPGEGSTTLTLPAGVTSFNATHQYLDDNPTLTSSDTYPVSVTVTDSRGASGSASTSVTVNNVAPQNVNAGADQTVSEGDLVSLSGSFTDPGVLDTHTQIWSVVASNGQLIPGGSGSAFSFVPGDNGTYTVTYTVTDDDLGSTSDTVVVTVDNVAPQNVNPGADQTVNEGDLVSLSGSFTDPGVLDTHTQVWSVVASNGQSIPNGSGSAFSFVPGDNGTYTVTYTVTDDDLGSTSDTVVVTVNNVAPQNVNAGVDQTVNEGDLVNLFGSFTDPGVSDTHTQVWNVVASNGQSIANGSGSSFSFVPGDNGSYTVTYTVTDDDLGTTSDTVVVTVNNVAPQNVNAGVDQTVNEGDLVSLLGSFTDPGILDTHTQVWSVVASNGQSIPNGSGSSFSFVPGDNGTYTVTYTVTDDDLGTTSDTLVVTVNNVAPQNVNAGVDQTVNEGDLVSLLGSFTDPGSLDTHTQTWSVVASNGQSIPNGSGSSFSFVPADNGTYTVTYTVTDDDLGTTSDTVVVTVNNVAPEIESIQLSQTTIIEGQNVTVSGTFSDPALFSGTETFSGTASWSDGVTTVLGVDSNGNFVTSRFFADDNPTGTASDSFIVNITITDDDLGSDTESSGTLTVNNVAPVLGTASTNATITGPAAIGQLVTATVSYSDVGLLDTHVVLINWGDGTSSSGTASGGTASGGHAYVAAGIYTVTMTVTDDDTGFSVATTTAYVSGISVVGGRLNIIGTNANDHVSVNLAKNGSSQVIRVHASFIPGSPGFIDIPAAGVSSIYMSLLGGDDDASFAGNMSIPTVIDGGSGSDHLNAGGGGAVVLGGTGNDFLLGGKANDILIGGTGADSLNGGSGEDILIGGTTSYDSTVDALFSLLAEWNSTRTQATRVANLRTGAGPVLGGIKLVKSVTVFDDGARDSLTGAADIDWYFYLLGEDDLNGIGGNEYRN